MEIVNFEYFSINEYMGIVDKYVDKDVREINFQNRVIVQLLDRLFINYKEIDIVDVSTQYKNKESKEYHSRKFYAWDHTPDLLLVKNWKYENIKKAKEDYLAIVEIKSPILDPISKESSHTQEEINDYLKNNQKVILTDCFVWRFFQKNKGRICRFYFAR